MDKAKKIITVVIFLIIIFVMSIMSIRNLKNKYENTQLSDITIASFENDFKSNLYLRNKIIEFQGLTQKLILNNAVEDSELGIIVRNKWGQLTSLPAENSLDKFKENIKTIADGCEDEDIDMIYCQAPFKILPESADEQLYAGFSTFANKNADNIIEYLKSRNIDVVDFREILENNKIIPKEELFYKTDHHWKIETAFYAFGEFIKYLSENYDYCTNSNLQLLTNKDNFEFVTMEDCYLGSWGRRTGLMYAGAEDFTYIKPDFEANFSIKRVAGDAKYEATGSFYDLVMSPKRVEKEKYGPSQEELSAGFGENGIYTDLYSVYMDGYTAEMQMTNHSIDSNKKVLIFHDSFGFPFSSFMALSAKEVRVIDLRNWHGDIKSYISDFQPNFVVTLYNPDQ